MTEVPYIGFGNDELEDAPKVKAGDKAPCPHCGELTEVRDGNPPTLQFITHCGSSWLAGIQNKYVGNKKPSSFGKLDVDQNDEQESMYCCECNHVINGNDIKNGICPICKRTTVMKRYDTERNEKGGI